MSKVKKTILISAIAVIVIVCVAVAVIILNDRTDSGAENDDTVSDTENVAVDGINELSVLSVETLDDFVVLKTSYATMKYPYAFSDLVDVEAFNENEYSELRFSANIRGNKAELFSLFFNHDSGHTVGTLDLGENGEDVSVTVVFYDPGEDLIPDDHVTFYAAQETANDIISSLEENENFISGYIQE